MALRLAAPLSNHKDSHLPHHVLESLKILRLTRIYSEYNRKHERKTRMATHENIRLVREYLAALGAGEAGESLGKFFSDDAVQIELPNKLNPTGGRSDLATIKRRSEEGKKLLTKQSYVIKNEVVDGDNLAVEAGWTGTLAIPIGELPPGSEMKAHFAMFFTFENGRILLQRNYDCFEPW